MEEDECYDEELELEDEDPVPQNGNTRHKYYDEEEELESEDEHPVPQTRKIQQICFKCNQAFHEDVGDYMNDLEKRNEVLTRTLDTLIASHKNDTNVKNEENQQFVPNTSQALTIVDPSSCITPQIMNMSHCYQMNIQDKDFKIEKLQRSHEYKIQEIHQQYKQKETITKLEHELEIAKLEAQLQLASTRLSLAGISDNGSFLMDQSHYVSLKNFLKKKNTSKLSLFYKSGDGPFKLFNSKNCVILLKSDGFLFGGTRDFLFTLTNPHYMEPTKFKAKHDSAYLKVTMNMLVWGSDVVIDCDSWKGKVSFPASYKDSKEGKGSLTFCGQTEFDVQEMEVWLLGS